MSQRLGEPTRHGEAETLKTLYNGYWWAMWLGSFPILTLWGGMELLPRSAGWSEWILAVATIHAAIAITTIALLRMRLGPLGRAMGWDERKVRLVGSLIVFAIAFGAGPLAFIWLGAVAMYRIPRFGVRVSALWGPRKSDYLRRYAELAASETSEG